MDPEVAIAIRDEVMECVDEKLAFTAYDITVAVRQKNVRLKHEDCKTIVHQMFEDGRMGSYTRELRNMGGAAGPAWHYHDASDYAAQSYASPPTFTLKQWVASLPQVNVNPLTPGSSVKPTKVVANADNRGTVCVPSQVVREAGFKPGNVVEAIASPVSGRVKLVEWDGVPPDNSSSVTLYTVDKYHNIRVTKVVMMQAQLFRQSYNVEVTGAEISLS